MGSLLGSWGTWRLPASTTYQKEFSKLLRNRCLSSTQYQLGQSSQRESRSMGHDNLQLDALEILAIWLKGAFPCYTGTSALQEGIRGQWRLGQRRTWLLSGWGWIRLGAWRTDSAFSAFLGYWAQRGITVRTTESPTSLQLGCAPSILSGLAHQLRGSHLLPQPSAFSLFCLNFFLLGNTFFCPCSSGPGYPCIEPGHLDVSAIHQEGTVFWSLLTKAFKMRV